MQNLTAVIPFWRGHATIGRLLDSLPADLPVIIVDDCDDEPLHLNRKGVRIIRLDERGYFSGAVNAGIAACQTDVLVLNQDIWLEGDAWKSQLAEARDKYALAGDGVPNHPAWPDGYVQGTFMYVNRQAWEDVGPLDAMEYPLWGATCEWQLRACRKGYGFRVIDVEGMGHERSETQLKGAGMHFGEAITEAIRREPHKARLFLRTPPTVSVVVPCYNYGHYLPDALNSLLGGPTCLGEAEPQTFASFEVLIVDDASTDDSWEVAQSLADRKRGVRALRLSHNRGTPKALNIGVKRSYGEYIQILSADDMLEPWTLERHYQTCRANPHRVVYGDMQIVKNGERQRVLKLPEYSCDLVLNKNPMSAGIMYPRRAWREAGGYPETMVYGREDWAFNIALALAGWCGVHIEDAGYLYRRERQNRSLKTGNRHKDEMSEYARTPDGTPTWREFFRNQLRALYPDAYEGRFPMGSCCGGKRGRMTSKPASNPVPQALPGQAGMTRLEYIGRNVGMASWWGPKTATRYAFGPDKPVGYVDDADVAGMLAMKKEKRLVFQRYSPPPSPPKPVVTEEAHTVNMAKMKVAEIRALEITPVQAEAMLAQEREGKGRKTVIAHLEGIAGA